MWIYLKCDCEFVRLKFCIPHFIKQENGNLHTNYMGLSLRNPIIIRTN